MLTYYVAVDSIIVYLPSAAHGVSTDGHTVYINAATCNTYYLPCQPPFIFDIPLPPGVTKDDVMSSQVVPPAEEAAAVNEGKEELEGIDQQIQNTERDMETTDKQTDAESKKEWNSV